MAAMSSFPWSEENAYSMTEPDRQKFEDLIKVQFEAGRSLRDILTSLPAMRQ